MELMGQLHVQASLPPGKKTLVPFNRRLGGPKTWSARLGKEKNLSIFETQAIKDVA